jgi:haloacid dehalogenase superfamily, subfamily IA, variant 3 with third motif having DD or ED
VGLILRGANADVIKAIVFDLDGVIVFPWGFANYLEKEHSITREHTREFFLGPFVACIKGEAEVKDALVPYLPQWNWQGTVDDFVEKWLATEDCVDERLIDLVKELRKNGWTCGLGTNQESNRANFIRTTMGFDNYFDHLFFSSELGSIKPEREFFDKARGKLGCSPDAILFIDNEEHYVEGARAAGWNALLFTTFQALLDESAPFYFAKN